jgi:hypothetical protein
MTTEAINKMDFTRLDSLITSFCQYSKELNGSALSILGASILLILSTNYVSPPTPRARLIYLLFIPAWICLSASIYYHNIIMRSGAAYSFAKDKARKLNIILSINEDYAMQLDLFQWGIFCMALWLASYLLWWIFIANLKPLKK